ncbi:uncharacterized protein LOC120600951 [Pteropus medius]|uniref:uncharacterized protein LOC120600951 n=1 Tax=Pteropus vampyrus TaxID=132908 RepID=UPI00196B6232|nr:uncharacterized protein LOC120600951 [Pteropus giganteus]
MSNKDPRSSRGLAGIVSGGRWASCPRPSPCSRGRFVPSGVVGAGPAPPLAGSGRGVRVVCTLQLLVCGVRTTVMGDSGDAAGRPLRSGLPSGRSRPPTSPGQLSVLLGVTSSRKLRRLPAPHPGLRCAAFSSVPGSPVTLITGLRFAFRGSLHPACSVGLCQPSGCGSPNLAPRSLWRAACRMDAGGSTDGNPLQFGGDRRRLVHVKTRDCAVLLPFPSPRFCDFSPWRFSIDVFCDVCALLHVTPATGRGLTGQRGGDQSPVRGSWLSGGRRLVCLEALLRPWPAVRAEGTRARVQSGPRAACLVGRGVRTGGPWVH